MSLDHIGEEIAADVAHHDAALHRILTNLRIFDDGGGYVSQGFRTCAQWLSWRVNWTLNTAREHVRVANALGRLPLIDHALESGQLSYCKVRALTRVATADTEATLLEMASQMTGHHLEKLCRKFAAVRNHDDPTGTSRPTEPDDDIDRRYVHRRDREDGMVVIEAVLHPDEADIVTAALERIAKERCRERADDAAAATAATVVDADDVAAATVATVVDADDVAAATVATVVDADDAAVADGAVASAATPSATHTTADAAIANAATHATADAANAAAPATAGAIANAATPAASTPTSVTANVSAETFQPRIRERRERQPTRAFDRATALVEMAQQVLRGSAPDRAPVDVMITIPIETLTTSGSPDNKSCCSDSTSCTHSIDDPLHVAFGDGGTFVSATAARRLACDAGIVALIEDADGNTLSVGRKTRTIPAATKRAMKRRDRKCRFPGCNAHAFLEGHHLEHWAHGGETKLANLILLCSYHHRFVHEYGFRLEFDPKTNTVTAHDPIHGRRLPGVTQPQPPADLGWPHILRHSDLSITASTQATWDATPVDFGEIVDVILRAEARASIDPDHLDDLSAN